MLRRSVVALDSGVGGLGIVSKLRRAVPDVGIFYVADHGFYPYGSRSDGELVERLLALVGAAIEEVSPDLVVIACNTASTIALSALRARFPVPFVGVVPPVKWAASLSRTRVIGLLATEATVRRAYVRDLQARFAPDCRILPYGARGLADVAEGKFAGLAPDPRVVARELERLFGVEGGAEIDTVCLGCTHYGMLIDELRAAGPDGVTWLDPAEAVARRVAELLAGVPGRAGVVDRAVTTGVGVSGFEGWGAAPSPARSSAPRPARFK